VMNKIIPALLILMASGASAQTPQDTIKKLKEVVIRPYFSQEPMMRTTGTIGLIDQEVLEDQPSNSFVAAANTVPGIRMEERSPGSYRLSVRGSLLRSPFGIRNIKIYYGAFPLTDASGNSYLNAVDVAAVDRLQLLKGPQGSIYGANSAGVILLEPRGSRADENLVSLNVEGGSFGAFRESVNINTRSNKYSLNITQAFQRSDGYRDHSAMNRNYVQAAPVWNYHSNANISALVFYSDLHYDTPGGLTETQFEVNPKGSRPAAGPNRSAIEQQAGIYSKTTFGGISHNWQINNQFKHVVSLFSSYTDFKNPFITNYETRKETTLGLRTYLEYERNSGLADWKFNLGLESVNTGTDFDNYDNNYGQPGAVQAADDLKAYSNFAFAHLSLDLASKLLVDLSASMNYYKYNYKAFEPQLMPRIGLSYLVTNQLSLRASVSKGYSPPTLLEVRSSDNIINEDLQPELGWNYEAGARFQTRDNRLQLDLTAFYFNLRNAIVRRANDNGTEFFVNSGGTKQPGLEGSLAYQLIEAKQESFFKSLLLRSAYTLSNFTFDQYVDLTNDYSGKQLTGVPKNTVISSFDLQLPAQISLFLQHNYTSSIPLNDGNTVYAKKYHLLQAKIGWNELKVGRTPVGIYVGGDNLLNQKYSLGNDLNAFGGRFYNPAATRNFYAGIAVKFSK
jgi:iron complex outermembrane receptor protein